MDDAKELLSKVITELAKDASKSIAKKVKDYFVDREFKEQVDLEYAYEKYLDEVYKTYSKSKSVIYINKSRELRKFFVPSDLRYEKNMPLRGKVYLQKSGSYTISGEKINDVLEYSNKIIITGTGGLGKTMHMKHFCISAIEQGFKIPIFIPLRWFNDRDLSKKPLEELIYDRLEEFGFQLDYKYFEYSLGSGKYVFLLDGYDEVSKTKINQITTCIQSFSHRYSDNSFIISSRQIDNIYGWDDFIVYSLCPLKLDDAAKLIWKLDFAPDMKKGFIDTLIGGMFEKYNSIASVPLLLSIMYMTYVYNATFPDSLVGFYDKAFETMLYRHDRREKAGFEREFTSGLGYTDFKKVFINFCYRSYFNDEYSFSETKLIDNINMVKGVAEIPFDAHNYKDDLVSITCMLILDGLEYVFIHRSFQEYYAAYYVSKMFENEQEEFCIDFINNVEEISDSQVYFGYRVLKSNRNKTIEFLSMLKYIDPKTFERVVLQPILKRIFNNYTRCGKDLIATAATYCMIYDVTIDEDHRCSSCSLSFKPAPQPDCQFTFNEFNVLCYFYKELFEKSLNRLDKIDSLVEDKCDLIEDYFDNYERDDVNKVRTIYDEYNEDFFYDVVIDILFFFDSVINRYESLIENSSKKVTYKDRVNNPKYYKH